MDSENVSRETSLPSVCGEILHPGAGKDFTLARPLTTEYSVGPLRRAKNELLMVLAGFA
jgi:hypothetical protein